MKEEEENSKGHEQQTHPIQNLTNDYDEDPENDLGSEAAGVVRGVSRSLGRNAARPMIGRLPRQVPKGIPKGVPKGVPRPRVPTPRRLPTTPKAPRLGNVKQVARVSDRLSTGYDFWSTAVESQQSSSQRWKQVRAFVGGLVKNTLLGLAVFESYGYVVGQMAPPPVPTETSKTSWESSSKPPKGDMKSSRFLMDQTSNHHHDYYDDYSEDDEDSLLILHGQPDEYARASLAAHWTAGGVAGSVHGVATSVLEGGGGTTIRKLWLQQAAYHTLHHTLAHSVLFGSYEFFKRFILQELHKVEHLHYEDSKSSTYLGTNGPYLAGFAVAGGLAGQLQHLVSHYTETLTFESGITSTKLSNRLIMPGTPAIRPLLMAFPPSAIGFIAFEYGKNLTS